MNYFVQIIYVRLYHSIGNNLNFVLTKGCQESVSLRTNTPHTTTFIDRHTPTQTHKHICMYACAHSSVG